MLGRLSTYTDCLFKPMSGIRKVAPLVESAQHKNVLQPHSMTGRRVESSSDQ